MHITRFTDFGLRILMYLSHQSRAEPVKIVEIAEQFSIPRNHLIKVVNHLSKLGWIETTRGRHGGLRLAIQPKQLKLGDILRQLEDSHEVVDCAQTRCNLIGSCNLKRFLDEGLNAFYQHLDQYTLADMTAAPTKQAIIKMHQLYI